MDRGQKEKICAMACLFGRWLVSAFSLLLNPSASIPRAHAAVLVQIIFDYLIDDHGGRTIEIPAEALDKVFDICEVGIVYRGKGESVWYQDFESKAPRIIQTIENSRINEVLLVPKQQVVQLQQQVRPVLTNRLRKSQRLEMEDSDTNEMNLSSASPSYPPPPAIKSTVGVIRTEDQDICEMKLHMKTGVTISESTYQFEHKTLKIVPDIVDGRMVIWSESLASKSLPIQAMNSNGFVGKELNLSKKRKKPSVEDKNHEAPPGKGTANLSPTFYCHMPKEEPLEVGECPQQLSASMQMLYLGDKRSQYFEYITNFCRLTSTGLSKFRIARSRDGCIFAFMQLYTREVDKVVKDVWRVKIFMVEDPKILDPSIAATLLDALS